MALHYANEQASCEYFRSMPPLIRRQARVVLAHVPLLSSCSPWVRAIRGSHLGGGEAREANWVACIADGNPLLRHIRPIASPNSVEFSIRLARSLGAWM